MEKPVKQNSVKHKHHYLQTYHSTKDRRKRQHSASEPKTSTNPMTCRPLINPKCVKNVLV